MFEKVDLVNKNEDIELAAICITKRYVSEQLKFLPISPQRFDYFMVAAYNVIRSSICDDQLSIKDVPSCLITAVKEEHETKKVEKSSKTDIT